MRDGDPPRDAPAPTCASFCASSAAAHAARFSASCWWCPPRDACSPRGWCESAARRPLAARRARQVYAKPRTRTWRATTSSGGCGGARTCVDRQRRQLFGLVLWLLLATVRRQHDHGVDAVESLPSRRSAGSTHGSMSENVPLPAHRVDRAHRADVSLERLRLGARHRDEELHTAHGCGVEVDGGHVCRLRRSVQASAAWRGIAAVPRAPVY